MVIYSEYLRTCQNMLENLHLKCAKSNKDNSLYKKVFSPLTSLIRSSGEDRVWSLAEKIILLRIPHALSEDLWQLTLFY